MLGGWNKKVTTTMTRLKENINVERVYTIQSEGLEAHNNMQSYRVKDDVHK